MQISNDVIKEINKYLSNYEKLIFNSTLVKSYNLYEFRKQITKVICANKLSNFLITNEYIHSYKYFKYYFKKCNKLNFNDYFNMLKNLSNDLLNTLDLNNQFISFPKLLVYKYVWSKNIFSPKKLRHGKIYVHSVYRLTKLHMQLLNIYDSLLVRALIY